MAILLELLGALAIVLVAFFVVTQLVSPTITGEPFFPMFHRKGVQKEITKAEKELQTVAQAEHLKELTDEVDRRKAQLEKSNG